MKIVVLDGYTFAEAARRLVERFADPHQPARADRAWGQMSLPLGALVALQAIDERLAVAEMRASLDGKS